jgi:hypothetical protein
MDHMAASIQPALRRLARRLAVGLFLAVWPVWAVGSLLAAGGVALVCRLFVASAAPFLHWLLLAPVVTTIPVLIICVRRAYRPAEVVALADVLSGGHGLLLTLLERNDPAWAESSMAETASRIALPRLRPWRKLAPLPPAAAFLAAALWLPQRLPSRTDTVLADEIAADLKATLAELKQQELITPVDEQQLQEEIERIRRTAQERVDPSSWEAADAVRERVVAGLAEKQDAVKWAEQSLARYAAAAQAGGNAGGPADTQTAELRAALAALAKSGVLAGAPPELQRQLASGKLPADAASLAKLTASLAKYLDGTKLRLADLSKLGKEFGRFDPSEFPLDASQIVPDGDGRPGQGALNRGRADAPLTWGKETSPFDRFKATPLPPGAARSADDWAPIAELPGSPEESPQTSAGSAARAYAAATGQTAWRRTLAPRHQSAVKKYFEK